VTTVIRVEQNASAPTLYLSTRFHARPASGWVGMPSNSTCVAACSSGPARPRPQRCEDERTVGQGLTRRIAQKTCHGWQRIADKYVPRLGSVLPQLTRSAAPHTTLSVVGTEANINILPGRPLPAICAYAGIMTLHV